MSEKHMAASLTVLELQR